MKNFNYLNTFMKDYFNESTNFDLPFTSLMGKTRTENGIDANGEWTKTTYESPDGSYSYTNFVRLSNNTSSKWNPKNEKLQKLLNKAVEEQNYEEAVRLRDEMRKNETFKEKLTSLKYELETAVKKQDYEKAIELRDTIKKLEK